MVINNIVNFAHFLVLYTKLFIYTFVIKFKILFTHTNIHGEVLCTSITQVNKVSEQYRLNYFIDNNVNCAKSYVLHIKSNFKGIHKSI